MGVFVSFEGGEGVGKSSQACYLSESLNKIKEKNIITREPGGTPEAEIIRRLIVNEKYSNFLPETELLLIYASRHEHLSKLIIPAIKNKTVICDRFIHSTICYQIALNKISKKKLNILHKEFAFNLVPDVTFFLNLDPKEGIARSLEKKDEIKYEKKGLKFHNKIQKEFLKLSKTDKKVILIDASKSIQLVHKEIIDRINLKKIYKKELPYSL